MFCKGEEKVEVWREEGKVHDFEIRGGGEGSGIYVNEPKGESGNTSLL